MNKTKVYKILSLFIKIAIFILSFAYVYYKICYHQDIENIEKFIFNASNNVQFITYISLVIMLIPINWGLEIVKWRLLISKIEKISFYDAFKAVLVGITFSSFTPNRIGDYFGRAFMLKNVKKSDGVLITIIGSIAQTLVTIVLGTLGFIWLKNTLHFPLAHSNSNSILLFSLIFIILSIFIFILYYKIAWLDILFRNTKILRKNAVYIQILAKYSFKELSIILVLSMMRYAVFVFQFFLLLKLFNINFFIISEIAAITVVYLISTIIPTIALSELGIKSASAIYIFELFFSQYINFTNQISISIVTATFLLWIFNLVIPALLGSFYIFKMKLFKTKANE